MSWDWISDKPLPEPLLTNIAEAMASLCHDELIDRGLKNGRHIADDIFYELKILHFNSNFIDFLCPIKSALVQ